MPIIPPKLTNLVPKYLTFAFSFFLPKRHHTHEKIKGQAFELNERGQVSEGAISWGRFIKTSFMAFLLPAGGREDRGKEFIPFADPLIL